MSRGQRSERAVLTAQSAYFLVTAVWPLVHYRSFELVTGRKRDVWLVKTVGALLVPVAAALGLAAARPQPPLEARVLAVGTAAALGSVEAVYALRGRIRWVYLVDAAVEALLVLVMLVATRRSHRRR